MANETLLQVWNIQEQLIKARIIHLVGEVNDQTMYSVCAQLDVLNNDDPNSRIILKINTEGGDADDCIAICRAIKASSAPVIGIIEGRSYSAGAAIAASCDAVYINKGAHVMIHQVQSETKGSLPDMKKDIERCEELTDIYLGFISEKTGLSISELKKKTQDDWWLTSEESIDIGLCRGYPPVYKKKKLVEEAIQDFESDPSYIDNNPVKKTSKKSK